MTLLLLLALAAPQTVNMVVSSEIAWTDTTLTLNAGDTVAIDASGTIRLSGKDEKEVTPAGGARGWRELIMILPVNEAGRGALIGRIGDSDAARAFLVGAHKEMKAAVGGKLYLAINLPKDDSASGEFQVTLTRTAAPTSSAKIGPVTKLPQRLLDSLPSRVEDAAGAPGDRVNFLIVGSETQVKSALDAAGWVEVDRNSREAMLRGLIASISKQAYVTLPMSTLMLFGRGQDHGYAQGDPLRVAASRHHFRIWKAPFTLGGREVWVGAGTHDIGFDRDQRNNGVTHKIDPDVDLERDYIARSLKESGMVAQEDYLMPHDTVKTARTATGEEFKSDGRTLVVYLTPDSQK